MKTSTLLRRMFVLALAMTLVLPLLPALAEEDAGNAPQNPAVILAANPTTGYTWTVEIADEAVVSVTDDGIAQGDEQPLTGAGGLQLGVVVVDGGAVHDQIGVADIGSVVANGDAHAQGTLGLGVLGLLNVRAGDGVAAAVQDLDQRIGAGTAAADKMDRADAFQQLGVIHTKNHNSGHLKIYPLPGRARGVYYWKHYTISLQQNKHFF